MFLFAGMSNKSAIAPSREGQSRSANRTEDTTFDRIWKYYFDEKNWIQLKRSEEVIRQRWELAWQMLCGEMLSNRLVAIRISKKFGISVRQGYEDVKNAITLFGSDPRKATKEAKREIVSEWIRKAIKKADAAGDLESLSRLFIRYNKLHGLEDHSDQGIAELLQKLKPHIIEFNADPETLEKQAQELIQDVEFEDVTNEE